jgi:hypothetical protein
MKVVALLLFLLTSLCSYGQSLDKVVFKTREEKYYLSKTCYDIIRWNEVVLSNKTAESNINKAIGTAVRKYKLDKGDAAARCRGEMDYEPEFIIRYADKGVLSYELTSYTYFKGAAHGGRQFENMNFDLASGRQIHFRELFDSSHIPELETLMVQRLKARLDIKDDLYLQHYKEQLPNPFFDVNDEGINLNFIGENYATSVVGFGLSWKEIEAWVNKKSVAGAFYNKTIK